MHSHIIIYKKKKKITSQTGQPHHEISLHSMTISFEKPTASLLNEVSKTALAVLTKAMTA
jgi:hypothetical protein